jgi:hypothetical protein
MANVSTGETCQRAEKPLSLNDLKLALAYFPGSMLLPGSFGVECQVLRD